MNKKGQGLSLNTIIIAIIVLVVLVVLILIFTGYFNIFGKEVASCELKAGVCVAEDECTGRVIRATCSDEALPTCCVAAPSFG